VAAEKIDSSSSPLVDYERRQSPEKEVVALSDSLYSTHMAELAGTKAEVHIDSKAVRYHYWETSVLHPHTTVRLQPTFKLVVCIIFAHTTKQLPSFRYCYCIVPLWHCEGPNLAS
jgi:hypothetical protein